MASDATNILVSHALLEQVLPVVLRVVACVPVAGPHALIQTGIGCVHAGRMVTDITFAQTASAQIVTMLVVCVRATYVYAPVAKHRRMSKTK